MTTFELGQSETTHLIDGSASDSSGVDPAITAQLAGWRSPDGQMVLADVSMSVARGQMTAIVGASGAGKSTLLRLLAGDLVPTAGSVRIGPDVAHLVDPSRRGQIGYVPQDDVIPADLPLARMLEHAARLRRSRRSGAADARRAVDRALAATDLTEVSAQAVKRLSGGQRRRASIAVELLTDPEVLLLDEPTSGLDPATARLVVGELRALADAGRTVVFVTHDAADLSACDRVVAIAPGGRVAFDGTVAAAMSAFDADDIDQLHHRLLAASPQPPQIAARTTVARALPARPPASRWRQWWTLTSRTWDVIRHNRLTLTIMLASPATVVAMFAVLFRPGAFEVVAPSPPATVMIAFWFAFGSFFFGLTFGLLQICPEFDVIRREHRAGIAPWLHVAAKSTALAPVLVAVNLAMLGVLRWLDRLPGLERGQVVRLAVTLGIGAVAALALGLLASAAVRTPAQASLALPMLCFPAVLFSGAIVPVPVMAPAGRAIAAAMSSRWAFEAIGRELGLRELLAGGSGLGRPLLAEFGSTWTVATTAVWGLLATFAVTLTGAAAVVLTVRCRRSGR